MRDREREILRRLSPEEEEKRGMSDKEIAEETGDARDTIMVPDKLYFSRKEIAEMLNVSERKIINITTKHKIRPKMQVYANNCGGKKNLYTFAAVEKIKRIIEKRGGGGA